MEFYENSITLNHHSQMLHVIFTYIWFNFWGTCWLIFQHHEHMGWNPYEFPMKSCPTTQHKRALRSTFGAVVALSSQVLAADAVKSYAERGCFHGDRDGHRDHIMEELFIPYAPCMEYLYQHLPQKLPKCETFTYIWASGYDRHTS